VAISGHQRPDLIGGLILGHELVLCMLWQASKGMGREQR
jgi:hypothetical protein